jgi:hypothetical protein
MRRTTVWTALNGSDRMGRYEWCGRKIGSVALRHAISPKVQGPQGLQMKIVGGWNKNLDREIGHVSKVSEIAFLLDQ